MRALWIAISGVAMILAQPVSCPRSSVRLATFNIEDFPRDDRQVNAAFTEIRRLGAAAIAVQEITRPEAFADAAVRELGPSWRTVTSTGPDNHRLGLLYDTDRVVLLSARTRDETRVTPGSKPILEARIRTDGREIRLLVVHLKAGGAALAPVRALQLAALDAVVAEGGQVVVLGDFNTTTDTDRTAVRALADRTGLGWATERLACTAYWDPGDGCAGTALDHVLTRGTATVEAAGGCAETGCWPVGRCPTWAREVSDHCPVTLDLR